MFWKLIEVTWEEICWGLIKELIPYLHHVSLWQFLVLISSSMNLRLCQPTFNRSDLRVTTTPASSTWNGCWVTRPETYASMCKSPWFLIRNVAKNTDIFSTCVTSTVPWWLPSLKLQWILLFQLPPWGEQVWQNPAIQLPRNEVSNVPGRNKEWNSSKHVPDDTHPWSQILPYPSLLSGTGFQDRKHSLEKP